MKLPRYDEDDDLPDGVYHDDEWPTVACKYCRADIAEDVDLCPKCGKYQSDDHVPPVLRRSWFIIVMMLLALACAMYWAAEN